MLACLLLATPTLARTLLPVEHVVAMPQPPPALVTAETPRYAEAMVAAGQAAAAPGMSLGVAVLDVATGDLARAGEEEFYSASLSKLMLVVDLLDRTTELSEVDARLIGQALSVSDDDAMNALWVRHSGPEAMTRVAGALGMAGTSTPEDPSQWGETVVSPVGFARLFQHILTEMDAADRAVIMDGLAAAQQRADDGFDQFFGLLGQEVRAYAKQGWMYYGSRIYLHSAGVARVAERDYVIVLMSRQPTSARAAAAVSTVAAAMLAAVPS